MIYVLIFLLILPFSYIIRISFPTLSHGYLIISGYSGTNITRFDWVGGNIGIKDNLSYTMWNYEKWNSLDDYTSSNLQRHENIITLRDKEPFRDLSNQIDVVWSHDFKFLSQAFTFTDDGTDIIYILNGSDLYDDEPIKLSFNKGDILSMNWGVINGTNVLFIGTTHGEIWSWYSNDIETIAGNSPSMNLEYRTENNESIHYIDVADVNTTIITGIHSIDNGNEINLLNSSMIDIYSRPEIGPICQGKWDYRHQIQYYYSVMGFSNVHFITHDGEQLNHENYYVLDFQVNNYDSFRFSFSDTFDLFGILVDNKIQVYNISTSNPAFENLIFEYHEEGKPIDNFAIHPSSPLIVFNRGLTSVSSNAYESEIVVANIINNNIEYILVPSVFITENEYTPIEAIYTVSYSLITFVIVLIELAIWSNLRTKKKRKIRNEVISDREESLYPKS